MVFYLAEEENTFVRFHAMQSIWISGTYTVLQIAVSIVFGRIPIIGFLAGIITSLLGLAVFILMIFLLVKAYQGEKYKTPFFGDKAEEHSKVK